MAIHPTAVVQGGAEIAASAEIGPYCIIGGNVAIGEGCRLVAHVNVDGHTRIGAGTVVAPFASLGGPPQSTSYRGEPTRLVIGANCDIRDSVTMNRGTAEGGGVTTVGNRGFFMACSHIGHDCQVGDNVIFANGAMLGGHCVLGDHVFMGGLSAAHQFSWIGAHAMVSGVTGIRADVIPFARVFGSVGRLNGINSLGMRRRAFSSESIRAVRAAYHMLFRGEGLLADRINAVADAHGDDPAVMAIVAFIRGPRKRPLCQPTRGGIERED